MINELIEELKSVENATDLSIEQLKKFNEVLSFFNQFEEVKNKYADKILNHFVKTKAEWLTILSEEDAELLKNYYNDSLICFCYKTKNHYYFGVKNLYTLVPSTGGTLDSSKKFTFKGNILTLVESITFCRIRPKYHQETFERRLEVDYINNEILVFC